MNASARIDTCRDCGKSFEPTSSAKRNYNHTCSRCDGFKRAIARGRGAAYNPHLTQAEIPQHYVPVPESGCWIWAGAWCSNGYGRVPSGRRSAYLLAHRVFFQHYRGAIPALMEVCHRCDTRPCVNPDHLFLGTKSDNIRDMWAKGRARNYGRNHPPKQYEPRSAL